MLRQKQPESIEEYSAALRERLAGVLPPEKIEEVVAETQYHLEERADELRRRADVYEKQAVAEFIPARKLAGGINRAWAATYLRHRGTTWLQNSSAVVCVLALLFALAQFLVISKLPLVLQNQNYVALMLLPPTLIVFCLALLACRPQIRRFTYGGVGVVLLFTILGGWLGTAENNMPLLSRFDAPARYRDALAMHQYRQGEERLLRDGLRFYQSAFSQQDVALSKKWNAALFIKLRQLDWHRANYSNTSTAREKRLQAEIQVARQRAVAYETETLWASHSPQPPAALRVENRYLIPKTQGDHLSGSTFRKLTPEARQSAYLENPGRHQRVQAQIAALQKSPAESTDALTEAMIRWRQDGPRHLETLQSYNAHDQLGLQSSMALMASSKWRFEITAARWLGVLGLYFVGVLLMADALGGFLGMLLLRGIRRRRPQSGLTA